MGLIEFPASIEELTMRASAVPHLDRQELEAWLTKQQPARPLGNPHRASDCPLYTYLRETCRVTDFEVGLNFLYYDERYHDIPQWATTFQLEMIEFVDNDGAHTFLMRNIDRSVTAAEALEILRSKV